MTSSYDPSRPAGTPSSKVTLLASLRRSLMSKPKRESNVEHLREYTPRPKIISSLSANAIPSLPLHTSQPVTAGRVRMSGSRPPSGYRSKSAPKVTPAPAPPPPPLPQTQPDLTPRAPPPHIRTRLARLFPLHSSTTSPTPSSSTPSFPSSSSRASANSSTSNLTTTSAPSGKQVRFSPSSSSARGDGKLYTGPDKVLGTLQEKVKGRKWNKAGGVVWARGEQ